MKMIRAHDTLDEQDSLFLVEGERMAVSCYTGEHDPWLDVRHDFDGYWFENLDIERMIDPVVIWEK